MDMLHDPQFTRRNVPLKRRPRSKATHILILGPFAAKERVGEGVGWAHTPRTPPHTTPEPSAAPARAAQCALWRRTGETLNDVQILLGVLTAPQIRATYDCMT